MDCFFCWYSDCQHIYNYCLHITILTIRKRKFDDRNKDDIIAVAILTDTIFATDTFTTDILSINISVICTSTPNKLIASTVTRAIQFLQIKKPKLIHLLISIVYMSQS